MTKKYKEWQDKHGFIHIQKSPTVDGSENGSTFTGAVEVLLALNGKTKLDKRPRWDLIKINDTQFRDRAEGPILRFSHDSMTGIHIVRQLDHIDTDLPIARWDSKEPNGESYQQNRKHWLHPRDLIMYSIWSDSFASIIGYLLSPLLFLMIWFSCRKERGKTSGKLMWCYRLACLNVSESTIKRSIGKLGLALAHKVMKPEHGDKPFLDCAEIYFKAVGHPIKEELKEWYNDK